MSNFDNRKAYIIGSGIAGMAAAAFLIEDGGMKGDDIIVFDQGSESGGGFDGQGSAERGYLCRGYRMFEKSIYLSTYDLFSKIPSPANPQKSLKDDFFEFNQKIKVHARARLVENGKIINARRMELSWRDRIKLIKLLCLPEKVFGTTDIKNFFTPDYFKTNFWFEWSTTFAFQPWHSLIEMKRYLARFVHDAPQLDTMTCVLSAPYCEHDSIILPLSKWLKESGVHFQQNCRVTDIEFDQNSTQKIVSGISLQNSKRETVKVKPDDLVFLTNGSMTADASTGSMEKPPLPVTNNSRAWDIWKSAAEKFEDLGNPSVFCNSINKSRWESFTVTFHDPLFFKLVEKFTGNKAGTGGLITFKDSNWIMSITLPRQPYFVNQPNNTFVCWGFGLLPDNIGNYIKKKMSDCNGKEILEELCFHLGFKDKAQAITGNAVCIPCMMPYIGSQFLPRKKSDRPEVVPKGSQNFACIGQFVEIPNEIVFTVECSIRSAKIAVKKLLNLSNKIPPLHQRRYNIRHVFNAIRTILG